MRTRGSVGSVRVWVGRTGLDAVLQVECADEMGTRAEDCRRAPPRCPWRGAGDCRCGARPRGPGRRRARPGGGPGREPRHPPARGLWASRAAGGGAGRFRGRSVGSGLGRMLSSKASRSDVRGAEAGGQHGRGQDAIVTNPAAGSFEEEPGQARRQGQAGELGGGCGRGRAKAVKQGFRGGERGGWRRVKPSAARRVRCRPRAG